MPSKCSCLDSVNISNSASENVKSVSGFELLRRVTLDMTKWYEMTFLDKQFNGDILIYSGQKASASVF